MPYDGTSNHDAKFHRHKKFPSAGAMGVAKLRGCGLERAGWGGVDCYCESVGDELMSSAGDTASLEGERTVTLFKGELKLLKGANAPPKRICACTCMYVLYFLKFPVHFKNRLLH